MRNIWRWNTFYNYLCNTRWLDIFGLCRNIKKNMNKTIIQLYKESTIYKNCKIFLSSYTSAAAAAALLQSCPTLCDLIYGSPPGSRIPGILQARILEWVAISFSNAWKWKVKVKSLSRVWLLATPWTGAYQAPPSMGFSRQEYWSGVPLPSPSYTLTMRKQRN